MTNFLHGLALAIVIGLGTAARAMAATAAEPGAASQVHLASTDRTAAPRNEWQRVFGMRVLNGGGAMRLASEPAFGAVSIARAPGRADGPRTEWQRVFGMRHLSGGGAVPIDPAR